MYGQITMNGTRQLLNEQFKNKYGDTVAVWCATTNTTNIQISAKDDGTDFAELEIGQGLNHDFKFNSQNPIYVKGTSGDVLNFYAY